MNTKLKRLRDACTDKQARFTQLIHQNIERAQAYMDAGFKPKNRRTAIQTASRLLTTNNKVMAYLDALKAQDDKNTNISRTMQLNRLDQLYALAIDQKNVSAGTSVIREQNEMLGYHRESAPNQEREQARKALIEQELEELERLVKARTADLSKDSRVIKIGTGA